MGERVSSPVAVEDVKRRQEEEPRGLFHYGRVREEQRRARRRREPRRAVVRGSRLAAVDTSSPVADATTASGSSPTSSPLTVTPSAERALAWSAGSTQTSSRAETQRAATVVTRPSAAAARILASTERLRSAALVSSPRSVNVHASAASSTKPAPRTVIRAPSRRAPPTAE